MTQSDIGTLTTPLRTAATLALMLALLPVLAINSNYLIAASEGLVPWCFPYLDSCTSISATGRDGFAFYFFKATMLPLAACYWLYWSRCSQLSLLTPRLQRLIRVLGAVSVCALVVYVCALGAIGDVFQLSRRIGIILYFTLTYLCQLLLVKTLIRTGSNHFLSAQQGLLGVILLIGLLTLILDVVMNDYDAIEDAFEWNIALLLHANFLLAHFYWRSLQRELRD